MARARKAAKPTSSRSPGLVSANGLVTEVLTLSEAAAYLRVHAADVQRLAAQHDLPGRQIGKEWRFLKSALEDWLRARPSTLPSKAAQLAVAGSWKDDPYVDQELREIYRQRGRPMTEHDE
jgi:excisionase family DNA binding protein